MAKSRTILIWHNNGEQQFTFTVNPERLRVSRPNCNRVERLAMGGTVNLWGIACELYGDGTRWREIAKKNGVTEPRKLPVGKVLVL